MNNDMQQDRVVKPGVQLSNRQVGHVEKQFQDSLLCSLEQWQHTLCALLPQVPL